MLLRLFLFTLLCVNLLLSSCSPKITSAISLAQPPLSDTSIVVVIGRNRVFAKEGTLIGEVRVGDTGFSTKCTYDDVSEILKKQAIAAGANVVKVTEHLLPSRLSSCHRVRANLYFVENPRKFEKEITWSSWRKLVWEDFKGVPDTASGMAAGTSCGFGFHASAHGLGQIHLSTQNTFDCLKSWVRPEYKNPEVLNHEQKHFDLSEIYARKLRKELEGPNLSVYGFSNQASFIYTQVFGDYKKRQEAYDRETDHGLNKENQEKWNRMIEEELNNSLE